MRNVLVFLETLLDARALRLNVPHLLQTGAVSSFGPLSLASKGRLFRSAVRPALLAMPHLCLSRG